MSSVLRPFRSEATILPIEDKPPSLLQLKPNYSYQPHGHHRPTKKRNLFLANGLLSSGKKKTNIRQESTNSSGASSSTPSGNTSTSASGEHGHSGEAKHILDETSPSPGPACSGAPSPAEPHNVRENEKNNHPNEVEPPVPKFAFFRHENESSKPAQNLNSSGLRSFYSTNTFPEKMVDQSKKKLKKFNFPKVSFRNRPDPLDDVSPREGASSHLDNQANSAFPPIHLHRTSPLLGSGNQEALFPHKTQNMTKLPEEIMAPRRSAPLKKIGSLFGPFSTRKSSPVSLTVRNYPSNPISDAERKKASLVDKKNEISDHSSSFSKEEYPRKIPTNSKFHLNDSDLSSIKSDERNALAAHYERAKLASGKHENLFQAEKFGKKSSSKESSSKVENVKNPAHQADSSDSSDSSSTATLSTLPSIREPVKRRKPDQRSSDQSDDYSAENTQSLATHAGAFALSTKMELWDEMEVMMFLKEINMEVYQELFLSQGVNGDILIDLDDIDLSLLPIENPNHRFHILKMISRYKTRLQSKKDLNPDDVAVLKVTEWLTENSEFFPCSPPTPLRPSVF